MGTLCDAQPLDIHIIPPLGPHFSYFPVQSTPSRLLVFLSTLAFCQIELLPWILSLNFNRLSYYHYPLRPQSVPGPEPDGNAVGYQPGLKRLQGLEKANRVYQVSVFMSPITTAVFLASMTRAFIPLQQHLSGRLRDCSPSFHSLFEYVRILCICLEYSACVNQIILPVVSYSKDLCRDLAPIPESCLPHNGSPMGRKEEVMVSSEPRGRVWAVDELYPGVPSLTNMVFTHVMLAAEYYCTQLDLHI